MPKAISAIPIAMRARGAQAAVPLSPPDAFHTVRNKTVRPAIPVTQPNRKARLVGPALGVNSIMMPGIMDSGEKVMMSASVINSASSGPGELVMVSRGA
jgi:hypothetical protein